MGLSCCVGRYRNGQLLALNLQACRLQACSRSKGHAPAVVVSHLRRQAVREGLQPPAGLQPRLQAQAELQVGGAAEGNGGPVTGLEQRRGRAK